MRERTARERLSSIRCGCAWLWLVLTMLPAVSARTLLVPNSYATIDDALCNACEDDTILLGPGTYTSPIRSDRCVSIIGASNVSSVLLIPRGKVGITCEGISAVENLRIVGGDVGVRTCGIRTRIARNVFVANRRASVHAILVCPYVENNTFIESGIAAIYVQSVRCTQLRVRNNTIVGAGYSGIYLADRTDIKLEYNVIVSRRWGVFGGPGSTVHADNPNCLVAQKPNTDNLGFQLCNSIFQQPEFASPVVDKPDFRLKSGSDLQAEYPMLGVQSE